MVYKPVNKTLQEILKHMQLFQHAVTEDMCLCLSDTEKVIGYLPGQKIDLKIPIGGTIENFKGTVSVKALELGKILREQRDSEAFGIPYTATAIPIIENGTILGVFTSVISNKKNEVLNNGAIELSANVEEMSTTTGEVTKAANDVANRLQEISMETTSLSEYIDKAHSILMLVNDIASQANLLGLNAAIEAARSGEHGRGFGVVATEIRKMGENSKNAVTAIHTQLETIQNAINRINESVHQIAAFTEEHAVSMEELHLSFEQIAKTAEILMNATTS